MVTTRTLQHRDQSRGGLAAGWPAAVLAGLFAGAACAQETPPAGAPPEAPVAAPSASPEPAPAPPPVSPAAPAPSAEAPVADASHMVMKNWYYPHYVDGKLVAIAEGAVAVMSSKDQADLIDARITFLRAVEGRAQPERVVVRGGTGQYDRRTNRARLEGQVLVRQEDGTELRTERADVDLLQRRVSTDGRVEIQKPGLTLTGMGVDASGLMSVLTLLSNVTAAIHGSAGAVLQGGNPPPAKGDPSAETFATCEGPATLSQFPAPQPETGATHELRLARNVVITRHDAAGTMRLNGDASTLDLFHGASPAAAAGTPAPSAAAAAPAAAVTEARRVLVAGNVRIVEEQGLTGTAQRLLWTASDDRLGLAGESGVRLTRGVYTVQGKNVALLRRDNRIVCRDDVEATFVPQASGADAAPRASSPQWTVRSDALDMELRPDAKDLEGMVATGHVTIAGDGSPAGSADSPGRQVATGETFRWEGAAQRGTLTGSPAGVQQGKNRMTAARVVLAPGERRVVLQGPKRVELAGAAPAADAPPKAAAPDGAPAEAGALAGAQPGGISATSRGDIVIANAEGFIEIGHGAVVSAQQTRLEADRLRLLFAQGPDGGLQRALGWGHVRLSDRSNASEVRGDYLRWDLGADEFQVEGTPFATLVQSTVHSYGQAYWYSRRTGGFKCVNRTGTKGTIRVQPE